MPHQFMIRLLKGQQSGPVSRILFPGLVAEARAATIHLGRSVARRLEHPTHSVESRLVTKPDFRETGRLADRPRPITRCLRGLAGGGVYPATSVTRRAVRSYRTISPLPGRDSVGLLEADPTR